DLEPLSADDVALLVIESDDRGQWVRRIDARHAHYSGGRWVMKQVVISQPDRDRGVVVTQMERLSLPASGGAAAMRLPWPNEMSGWQLMQFADHLRDLGLDDSSYRYALQRKVAQPVSLLLMVLVVVALSLPREGGGGRGTGYSGAVSCLLFGLLLYISGSATAILSAGERLPVAFAAWLPNLLFGGMALFILMKRQEVPPIPPS
ncbi:MAG: LptF/LptG family permease, partial [Mariprofundales bacterium]|nr:LptF/LptG family permease [Mariprofundales bacterium]